MLRNLLEPNDDSDRAHNSLDIFLGHLHDVVGGDNMTVVASLVLLEVR